MSFANRFTGCRLSQKTTRTVVRMIACPTRKVRETKKVRETFRAKQIPIKDRQVETKPINQSVLSAVRIEVIETET